MNAMTALTWQEIFTAEVRGIQSLYPKAHKALLNWGVWSRDLSGVFPKEYAANGMWEQYSASKCDPDGWGEIQESIVQSLPAKQERTEEPKADEKLGTQVDEWIHKDSFPAVWRNVVRAAYYYRVAEFQYPIFAVKRKPPMNQACFLMFLAGSLKRVEREMEEV
jgi:hypothetical protein